MAGMETPQQVAEAVAYETASSAEKDYASVLASAPQHAYTAGQCTYCGHCAPCPVKIDIAMVNKLLDLADLHEELPPTLRAHYDQLEVPASACVGCQSCEGRCPFGVTIAQRMQRALARSGIRSRIFRAPRDLTDRGCAYARLLYPSYAADEEESVSIGGRPASKRQNIEINPVTSCPLTT